ncbi:MAG: hypothetical protein WB489_03585, partial [Pseudolabrys sp.]
YIPHDDRTHCLSTVMPALVAGIHVFSRYSTSKTGMTGTRPGMTAESHCTKGTARSTRGAMRDTYSSWPGLSRPSTSFLLVRCEDKDARHKAGHDGGETVRLIHS